MFLFDGAAYTSATAENALPRRKSRYSPAAKDATKATSAGTLPNATRRKKRVRYVLARFASFEQLSGRRMSRGLTRLTIPTTMTTAAHAATSFVGCERVASSTTSASPMTTNIAQYWMNMTRTNVSEWASGPEL